MKKTILTATLSLLLAAAPVPAAAGMQQSSEDAPVVENVAEEVIMVEPVEIEAPATPAIPESKIARKMTQAEKSRNAAENDGWGGAITLIAMCIVLSALVVLSILFMIFGKVSESLLTARKRKAKAAADHSPHDDHELAPGEVIAAISMALAEYFGDPHDLEDTHLTIKRLQKAYSPWNSKIYNLRHPQDHHRNPSTEINFNESKRIQI